MACRSGGPINRPLRCDRPRADRYPAGDSMRTRVNRKTVLVALLALGGLMSPARAATFVYVGNADSQDITVLELKSTGKLTPQGSGPLADSMAYVATDRSGKFLLSASYGGNKVAVNPIAADGIVQPAQQVIATEPNAHCILPDPSNRYVLHTSLGGDLVYQDKFDAKTGKLTPNDPPSVSIKAKAGARHLVFSPSGTFVYLVDELDASIYVFPWDAKNGTLKKEVQVATALPRGFEGKPWAADIHLTPDGRFLYASERTTSTLAAFSVDPKTGLLTPIESTPTEKQPRSFNIDPAGRYLLAVGQLSNSMTSYAIDKATGKLTRLKEYPVGKNPNWVEIVSFSR